MRVSNSNTNKIIDFNMLLAKYAEKYEVVHHLKIGDEDFVYRLLSRHELKGIVANNSIVTELDKEDAICSTCLLYPEGYDFDDCEAGVPSELCTNILQNSFLDSVDATLRLILHFRDEMEELDNQMACIISEAFPNYSLEEIESWSNLKFCKMFSRAEWKFKTLRDTAKIEDITTILEDIIHNNSEDVDYEIVEEDEIEVIKEPVQTQPVKKQSKMTPEKLRELEDLKRKFPEINWDSDEILTHGADDAISNADSISTVSPALRPGWH